MNVMRIGRGYWSIARTECIILRRSYDQWRQNTRNTLLKINQFFFFFRECIVFFGFEVEYFVRLRICEARASGPEDYTTARFRNSSYRGENLYSSLAIQLPCQVRAWLDF